MWYSNSDVSGLVLLDVLLSMLEQPARCVSSPEAYRLLPPYSDEEINPYLIADLKKKRETSLGKANFYVF